VARSLIVVLALVTPAAAAPLSLELGGGDGIGHASRAGTYRDDGYLEMRLGIALNCRLSLDPGFSWDTARIEPGLHIGMRVRALEPTEPVMLYLRGDVAVVAASHIWSNYDLLAGVGVRHNLRPRWAIFGEVNAIARVGEVETLSLRAEIGVAFTSRRFWR
jgi:hypothetical protein